MVKNTVSKGLIALKQEKLAEVQVQLTALTGECQELWLQFHQLRTNGETLKAIEVEGQWKYKQEKVIPELSYQVQELERELGGFDYDGYATGLIGESRRIKLEIASCEKDMNIYTKEIEQEKARHLEHIDMLNRDIEESSYQQEAAKQRLTELLGG